MRIVLEDTNWVQVLTGDHERRARYVVDTICHRVLEHRPSNLRTRGHQRRASYGSGVAGQLLLLTELRRADHDTALEAKLDEIVATCFGVLEEPQTSIAFFHSFPGTAWTLQQAAGVLFDAAPSFGDAIDAALERLLSREEPLPDFDLMSGVSGIAAYYDARLIDDRARRTLRHVVRQLGRSASSDEVGTYWRTPQFLLPIDVRVDGVDGQVNLGVAHGTPGVIGALSLILEAGGIREAELMLRQAVAWLLAQQRRFGDVLAFPDVLRPDNPRSRPSRIAWCYGDASIAAVLHRAARALHSPQLAQRARAIAETAAARGPEDFGVEDDSVCHGSAGVAHLFNRLYQETRSKQCLAASMRWYDAVLDSFDDRDPCAGFRFRAMDESSREPVWVTDYGLLAGLTGVALALVSGYSAAAPVWDAPLMIGPVRSTSTSSSGSYL